MRLPGESVSGKWDGFNPAGGKLGVSGERDRLRQVGNRGMESLTLPNRGGAGRGGASGVGTTALEQQQSELNVIWPQWSKGASSEDVQPRASLELSDLTGSSVAGAEV